MQTKTLKIPTLQDIEEARERISKLLCKTPLRHSPSLSQLTGAEVYIKFENHNPTCAFKVRGGINYVAKNKDTLNSKSLLTGSTGNHGQSIAYAGNLFGIPVTIAVPEGNNPDKVKAMENLGAKVIFHGKDVFETWIYCEKLAKEGNYVYVHAADEPDLICGVGTIGLEVYEDLPDIDCYITAVGGGSGICGASIALKGKNPKIKTYAVQTEGAPVVHDSFKEKKLISYPILNTFAEGLATRQAFELPFKILQEYIDDIFLVSDDELKKSILLFLEHTHNLAEGAGAAALAGLIKNKDKFKGEKVVCVLTGGNLQTSVLKDIMNSL